MNPESKLRGDTAPDRLLRVDASAWRNEVDVPLAPVKEQVLPLEQVAEHSRNAVIICNAAGDIVYVNRRFTEVTGYTREEALGRNPRFLKSGRLSNETYQHLWSKITQGREWRGTLSNRKKNGDVFWDYTVITPVKDTSGAITHYLAVKEDVTQRRNFEQALDRSEERLRAILENSQSGYCYVNPLGRLEQVNAAWLTMHSYHSADEVVGRAITDFVAEEDRDAVTAAVDATLREQPAPTGEFRRLYSNGSYGLNTCTWKAVRENGKVIAVEGFITDTTRLHLLEERYQTLFERIIDGLALHEMIYDEAGQPQDFRYIAVNAAFETMVGRLREDVVGRRASELFPLMEVRWINRFNEVLHRDQPLRFSDFTDAFGGKRRYFEVAAFPVEHGRFACVMQDVTERRLFEQNVRHAQKMEAIGLLTGGIAHDFNNLLTVILMQLELLAADHPSDPAIMKPVETVLKSARQASNLTRQLMMFSRRQEASPETVDLNQVCAEMVSVLRCLMPENVAMRFTRAPDPAWVIADENMLQQVLMNLCLNARDAMASGGDLVIAIDLVDVTAAMVLINPAAAEGRHVQLSVRDTGCGMSEAIQKRVFEPFFTTKGVGKGTGLGLATVFGIVKQHGGWISLDSAEGVGSTFTVHLPAVDAPKAVLSEPEATSVHEGQGQRILIVEDTQVVRELAATTLKRAGYSVVEAVDGDTALARWTENNGAFDIIVSDMVLPGPFTGRDLADRFCAEKPDLQVLLTSGHSAGGMALSEAQQKYDLLGKPYAIRALIEAVHRCAERIRAKGTPAR